MSGHTAGEVLLTPEKAIRLSDMIRSILDELHRSAPDGSLARERLAAVYGSALVELGSTLSDPLLDELANLQTGSIDDSSSIDEVRIALAQLSGWVLGLLLGTGEGLVCALLRDEMEGAG